MAIEFPTNTVVMIIVVMIGLAAGSWFSLSQMLVQLPIVHSVKQNWRWGVAIVLITWLFGRLALALNPPNGTVLGTPFIIAFLVLGLLAGILPLLLSPVFRQIIRAIPPTWLVGIHAIRILGFLFLALIRESVQIRDC